MPIMLGDRCGVKRWRRTLLAVVALAAVSGCVGDDAGGEGDRGGPVGVDGYTAVIADFLPAAGVDGSRPVVYVARLSEDPFALEDQVAMIAAVEESHDLRFVDEIGAAIDDEDSEAPPRDDGLLFGIGTISAAVPHVVRVEIYRAAGVVDARKVTLTVRDDVWQVDRSEPVDPEVLLGDE